MLQINQDKPSSISTDPTWTLDANQIQADQPE